MTQALSLSLAAASFENFWAYIVPVVAEDTMSAGEAADLIDSTYNVNSCAESYDAWNQQNIEPYVPEAVDFDTVMVAYYPAACDESTNVQAKIFIAYPLGEEQYKIRLSNGRLISSVRVQETVTHFLTVKNATSITLNNPIVRALKMAWQNSATAPDLSVTDNTIHWQGEATGTIKATFTTIYDLVTVCIDAAPTDYASSFFGSYRGNRFLPAVDEEEQATDCEMLLFYHYQYTGQSLALPEKDTSVSAATQTAICKGRYAESVTVEGEDKLNCQEACEKNCPDDGGAADKKACVSARDKCLAECDGDASCEYDCYEKFNACYRAAKTEASPECRDACEEECGGDCYGQHNDIEICHCDTDTTRKNNEFYAVECEETEQAGSTRDRDPVEIVYKDCGKRDEFWDLEHYAIKCPEEPPPNWPSGENRPMRVLGYYPELNVNPNNLPWCELMTRAFRPTAQPSQSTKAALERKYKNISFVGVGPKDSNLCGEWTIEQVKPCEAVPPPVVWGGDVPLVTPGWHVSINISGGTPPFKWTVSGSGFLFGNNRNNIETNSRSVVLYADYDACGTCHVAVTDQCGEDAGGKVKSTEGEWKRKYEYNGVCGGYCSCEDGTVGEHTSLSSCGVDGGCSGYQYENEMRYHSSVGCLHVREGYESDYEYLNASTCAIAVADLPGVHDTNCTLQSGFPWVIPWLMDWYGEIWACPNEEVEIEYMPN